MARTASADTGVHRLEAWALRHHVVALTVIGLVFGAAHVARRGWSWHYVETGVRTLWSAQGLHLYALHPELQMGPLTFVVAALFVLAVPSWLGPPLAALALVGVGVGVAQVIRRLATPFSTTDQRRWFRASALVMATWGALAVQWTHPDDALALLLGLLALLAVRRDHVLLAALATGLAIDAKPWIAPMAVVLLLAPRRRWPAAAGVLAATVAAAWLPFFLADPSSDRMFGYAIPISPTSTLALLGLTGDTPAWCRAAQLGLGVVLSLWLVARRRETAVLLAVVAVRMLLDPATKSYYDAGLLAGAALVDAALAAGAWPVLAASAAVLVTGVALVPGLPAPLVGTVRTVALLGLVAAALGFRSRRAERVPLPGATLTS